LCRGREPAAAVRLAGLVRLDVAAVKVSAATAAARGRRTGVQVFAADGRRWLGGRGRVLRGQREQRLRGLGRMPDPSAAVVRAMMAVAAVVVTMMMMMAMTVMAVIVVVVMVMVTAVVLVATASDVFQLQVNRVLLPGTADAVVGRDLVAVQVLVAEPVAAERLGRQVVPGLDGFHGGAVPPVRGRRLRLDRVLSRRAAGRRLRRHRVLVPVQRVRAQRRRVRRRPVLGQTVLVSATTAAAARRRARAYPLVRRVKVVHQFCVTVLMFRVVPRRVPSLFVSFAAI